ncbi:MAG: bis(5'-nucleosyl)-tetraphosphatase (symmetrical) YqeK [Coriobacteriia bacterium]|nr:bis(5'-nucleosyl)-tetraphosphatase (symmetrical) YqeK [Coriobacteriia bacterium]MCL2749456.1 bis(5'-nucleosyl)-tetraphosphatase (symmetrical) YqeK [Coriobacteriia bacterium]
MLSLSEIYDDARKKLEGRLTQYRLLHSISTSEIAALMAEVYGVNREYALVAGLLHDWDKAYSDPELLERANQFGIQLPDDPQKLASLIHAHTGARAVAEEYPSLPSEILQAIERHTSAATNMTPLDMIIYIADMIEPLRTAPNLPHLRSLAGNIPLEELFSACYRESLERLIRRNRYLHPNSAQIWNTYVKQGDGLEQGDGVGTGGRG